MSLFEPLRFRNGATAPNRAWLAPMTNGQSHADGSLSDDELAWLGRRARGGFGVVETCAAHVALDGRGWQGELGVYDDALLPGLTRLASAVRAAGALGLVQLFHGGLRAPASITGVEAWSASAAPDQAREATEVDLDRVQWQFREAARRSEAAGFEGVELHAAHGYLLGQFLSATQNRRADRWGGSFDGRSRLLRGTLRAVRDGVSPGFVVGVRLSPEDFGNAEGLDLDESLELARILAVEGADFIHVSLWDAHRNTRKRPAEHPVPLFRAAVPPDVALIVAGKIWTRADAESLLEKGASAVAVGRAAIANPEWARDIRDPAWTPRRPPLTIAELRDRTLSADFAAYMRSWKGFVAD